MSNLLKSLARHYRKRGWKVYSNELDRYENIPVSWNGQKPDIISVLGNNRVAVCVETPATLKYEKIADKWRTIVQNNDIKLTIVVREPETLELARGLAVKAGVPVTIQLMKKTLRRSSRVGWNSIWDKPKIDWLLFGVLIVVIIAFSIMYLPDTLSKFKLKTFYSPKDRERQEEMLKQKEQEDRGKSDEEKRDRRRNDMERKKEYDDLRKKYERIE